MLDASNKMSKFYYDFLFSAVDRALMNKRDVEKIQKILQFFG